MRTRGPFFQETPLASPFGPSASARPLRGGAGGVESSSGSRWERDVGTTGSGVEMDSRGGGWAGPPTGRLRSLSEWSADALFLGVSVG